MSIYHALAADYVLVWAGGGGDDLAKSPHMARIGNSVYRDICPGDPTCSQFGFYHGGRPTPMMENCLLYKMCLHGQSGIKPLVRASQLRAVRLCQTSRTEAGHRCGTQNSSLFAHVFTSRYGKVRIFKVRKVSKKSKEWIADPKNRVCDAPGSWYCAGQYPPPLHKLIARRHNFAQVEDFNRKKDASDEKYQEDYMARMNGQVPPDSEPEVVDLKLKFVGCYGSESQLPASKEYGGGVYGANIGMAKQFAIDQGKKYIAIARAGVDGHNFAFNEKPKGAKLSDKQCNLPCADHANYKCGCADAFCGDGGVTAGEENRRRWLVYALTDKKKKKKKSKNDL